MVSAKYQFVPGYPYMWNSTVWLDIKVQPENHLHTKYGVYVYITISACR